MGNNPNVRTTKNERRRRHIVTVSMQLTFFFFTKATDNAAMHNEQ